MKTLLPKVLFALCCLALVLTLLASYFFYTVVDDHDGRGSLGFRFLFAPVLGGGSLLLAIWSCVLYSNLRRRRDFWSFIMAALSFVAVLGETIALFFVPLHGPW